MQAKENKYESAFLNSKPESASQITRRTLKATKTLKDFVCVET
jgi:hypothetical protein